MKRIVFIFLIAGLLAPAGLMAQKVYLESGKVILDMTETGEGIGLPEVAITSVSKTAVYALYTAPVVIVASPSYTYLMPSNYEDNRVPGVLNAAVYQKLEIAPRDMTEGGTLSTSGDRMQWGVAYNNCKALNHNGTGWRLPTQREMLMILIFKTAIESLSGVTAFNVGSGLLDYYQSMTEVEVYSTLAFSFFHGAVTAADKNVLLRARCVREVP